jgi:hypothetical protein
MLGIIPPPPPMIPRAAQRRAEERAAATVEAVREILETPLIEGRAHVCICDVEPKLLIDKWCVECA